MVSLRGSVFTTNGLISPATLASVCWGRGGTNLIPPPARAFPSLFPFPTSFFSPLPHFPPSHGGAGRHGMLMLYLNIFKKAAGSTRALESGRCSPSQVALLVNVHVVIWLFSPHQRRRHNYSCNGNWLSCLLLLITSKHA